MYKKILSMLVTSPFDSIWLEISTNWHTSSQGPKKKCIKITKRRIDPCPAHTARNKGSFTTMVLWTAQRFLSSTVYEGKSRIIATASKSASKQPHRGLRLLHNKIKTFSNITDHFFWIWIIYMQLNSIVKTLQTMPPNEIWCIVRNFDYEICLFSPFFIYKHTVGELKDLILYRAYGVKLP